MIQIYGNRLDMSYRLRMCDFGADRLGLNINTGHKRMKWEDPYGRVLPAEEANVFVTWVCNCNIMGSIAGDDVIWTL